MNLIITFIALASYIHAARHSLPFILGRSRSPSSTNTRGINLKSLNEYFKEAKGRRKCVMKKYSSVFEKMNSLASNEGYIISMYRETKLAITVPLFPQTTDSFLNYGTATYSHLIQSFSDADPSKKLCIFTQNKFENFSKVEEFTKRMIAAEGEDEKEAVFKKYKFEIGLPTGISSFDYAIYAWVSLVDCAFYNLGNPVHVVNPVGHVPPATEQAQTEVLSESHNKQYSIQVSSLTAQTIPVTIVKVDKNSDMKITPFNMNYRSFNDLYGNFCDIQPLNSKTISSCSALFVDGFVLNAINVTQILNEAAEAYSSTMYIKNLRTSSFSDEKAYSDLFSYTNSDSVTLITWKPVNGSCHFPQSNPRSFSSVSTGSTDQGVSRSSEDETHHIDCYSDGSDSDDEYQIGAIYNGDTDSDDEIESDEYHSAKHLYNSDTDSDDESESE